MKITTALNGRYFFIESASSQRSKYIL